MKLENLYIADFENGILGTRHTVEIKGVRVRRLDGTGTGIECGQTGQALANYWRIERSFIGGQDPETDIGILFHGGLGSVIDNVNVGDNLYGIQVEGNSRLSIDDVYADPQVGGTAAGAIVYVNSSTAKVDVDGGSYQAGSEATTSYPMWVEDGALFVENYRISRSIANNYGAPFRVGAGTAQFHWGAGNKVDVGDEGVYVSIDATNRLTLKSVDSYQFSFEWDTSADAYFVVSPPFEGTGPQFAFTGIEMFNITAISGTTGSSGIEVGWQRDASQDDNAYATIKAITDTDQFTKTTVDTWVNQGSLEGTQQSDQIFTLKCSSGDLTGGTVLITGILVRFRNHG
jgi:hypothetical protein